MEKLKNKNIFCSWVVIFQITFSFFTYVWVILYYLHDKIKENAEEALWKHIFRG